MMEMDGLDSAKWQKSRGRDINGILGKFNEEDDKIENSGHLPPSKRRLCPIFVKNVGSPDIHGYSAV